jgi:hypothetical protein
MEGVQRSETLKCRVAAMNEVADRTKKAANEEEGGTAFYMTALPIGNRRRNALVFTL